MAHGINRKQYSSVAWNLHFVATARYVWYEYDFHPNENSGDWLCFSAAVNIPTNVGMYDISKRKVYYKVTCSY